MSSSIASKESATGAGGLVLYDFDILSFFLPSWWESSYISRIMGVF